MPDMRNESHAPPDSELGRKRPSPSPLPHQHTLVYPTEPESASVGIEDAIRLLDAMTASTWQTRRDAALERLHHALARVCFILRSSE